MGTQDLIILKDLAFYGYHGVHDEEAKLGQRFRIDVTCGVDLEQAGRTDALEASISYSEIYNIVKTAFEMQRFKIIEAVGQHIVDQLFAAFPTIEWIRIRVRKPEAPIPMVAGEAAIELYRQRLA
jgi:dihydroneopterin aldolase